MQKKWEIQSSKNIEENEIKEFVSKHNVNNLIAKILIKRGITEEGEVRKFLKPTRNDFYDPFLIKDMDKAITRILEGIRNKEQICIYGDYDVDGITSISVLKNFFSDRGIEVKTYIPDRMHEGYGVNKGAIEKIVKEGTNLLITVDCGITSVEEVDYATELGLDVIITDHHEPKEELPKALAVIDNKRKDSTYPFRELAGVGVAFKIIQAISIKLDLKQEEYLKYLDIVAIGTVADIVPLLDENRVIAKLRNNVT